MAALHWTVGVLTVLLAGRETHEQQPSPTVTPFEVDSKPVARGELDQLVFARWREKGVRPARPCSDGVFVRRVFLDLLGMLPSAEETEAFLRDRQPSKRGDLIDRLLARPEFADYQAMRWSEVLRVKSEFPINLWPNAAQAYHRWIREAMARNLRYDAFVRELLAASGSNFRVPPVNFYRAIQSREPEAIARAAALSFLGQRAERWPPERLAGFAGFFAQVGFKATAEWKEEIVFFDPERPARPAVFPDGKRASIAPGQDPRQVLVEWLVDPKNPWLARSLVNRVWSWCLGRGIVHEPDDLRSDNPPSHPALLAWLERRFVASGFDLRGLYRLILDSQTYQLSCVPRDTAGTAEALFAVYPLRRVEPEVLIDALNQITGTTESYTSAIPEPFSFLPPSLRAVALPDGSITSSFLELFGRPPRDTGLEAERSERCSAAQRLHLLNSGHVQRKLEQGPKLRALLQSRRPPREVMTRLYLTILSRPPTEAELAAVAAHAQKGGAPREAAIDVAWALLNSAEFLYRH